MAIAKRPYVLNVTRKMLHVRSRAGGRERCNLDQVTKRRYLTPQQMEQALRGEARRCRWCWEDGISPASEG